jgi:hypothetical protein
LGITLGVVKIARGRTYVQGEIEASMGGEWGSKGMDGCPLILPPLQRHDIMIQEDLQEVARSALVKGIESKVAADMTHTVSISGIDHIDTE